MGSKQKDEYSSAVAALRSMVRHDSQGTGLLKTISHYVVDLRKALSHANRMTEAEVAKTQQATERFPELIAEMNELRVELHKREKQINRLNAELQLTKNSLQMVRNELHADDITLEDDPEYLSLDDRVSTMVNVFNIVKRRMPTPPVPFDVFAEEGRSVGRLSFRFNDILSGWRRPDYEVLGMFLTLIVHSGFGVWIAPGENLICRGPEKAVQAFRKWCKRYFTPMSPKDTCDYMHFKQRQPKFISKRGDVEV